MVMQNAATGTGGIHEFNKHPPSACSGLGIMLSPINTTENKTILYSLHSLQSSEGGVDCIITQIKQADYYDAQKKRKM